MEDSEAFKKVVALGKTIVKELQLEPGVDTLARWMAHYLAQKIEQVETLSGEAKKKAEQECFDTILKLWEHRSSASRGNSFLSDFDALFETLQKLMPHGQYHFYIPSIIQGLFDDEEYITEGKDGTNESKSHFSIALSVDKLARTLIADLLAQGITNIDMAEEKKKSINDAIDLIDYPDTRIIRFTTDYAESMQAQENEDKEEMKEKIRELQEKINDLEKFDSIKNSLLENYQKQVLEIINQVDKS